MNDLSRTLTDGFDSRASLECCALPSLKRRVGVTAGPPFHHVGLNAQYVDISRETLRINTQSWGNCYPMEDVAERIRVMTFETVAELDAVIDELKQHRDRLLESIGETAAQPVTRVVPGPRPATKSVIDVPLPLFEDATP